MKLRYLLTIIYVCFGLLQSKADTYTNNKDNTIYISDVSVKAGGQVTLTVNMKNKVLISGFQFDLLLPEGVTVDSTIDAYGDPEISAIIGTRVNPSKFTFSTSFPEQNNKRHLTVLCYATNSNVQVGDGEVATITLNVAGNVNSGDYDLILRNVVVSNTTDTYDNSKDITSKLTITGSSSSKLKGDVNEDGVVDIRDVTELIDILLGKSK